MTYFIGLMLPLLLLITAIVLLRRCGMKSNVVHLLDDSQFHLWEKEQEGADESFMVVGEPKLVIQSLHLLPQEKSNPTSIEKKD